MANDRPQQQNQPQLSETNRLQKQEQQDANQNHDHKVDQIDKLEKNNCDLNQNQFQENEGSNQTSQRLIQCNPQHKQSEKVIQGAQSQYSDDILFLSSCLRNHRDSFDKSLSQKKVKFDLKPYKSLLTSKIDSESSDDESEKSEPGYDIKEDMVIQWHRDQKKEKFVENCSNLQLTMSNIFLYMRIFHPIFGIFARFERRQPRPVRFCVVYMTILNTCYMNIYFQVPLLPFQSILYSIFSTVIQDIEILIIRHLMIQRFKLIRGFGWMIFSGASALFIYLIVITMAFEAAEKQDDVRRSNEWGLNFIIGFIFTNFVAAPLQLVLSFKALQLSLQNSVGFVPQLLINLFADSANNHYFEVLKF